MPEYLSPGVYVEEVSSGARPIEGVSTSTGGIVGPTERGPTRPRLTTSWGDFVSWFGGIVEPSVSYMPFAARGFFDNGGQRLFVARAVRSDAVAATLNVTTDTAQILTVDAVGPGDWGNRVFLRISPGTLDDPALPLKRLLRVTLLYYRTPPPLPFVDPLASANIASPNRRVPDVIEDYDNLGVRPEQADYFLARLGALSHLVEVAWANGALPPAHPDPTPVTAADGGFVQLDAVPGSDGVAPLTAAEFQGDESDPPDQRTVLAALGGIDQISILMVPDAVNDLVLAAAADRTTLTNAVIDQCELLQDRFAVITLDDGIGDVSDPAFTNTRDTSYAALYYPWVRVMDPRTSLTHLVPPVGHIAGIYARSDVQRGVWKAPANEALRGIVNQDEGPRRPLEFLFNTREQGILNPLGVNVIRDFRGDRLDIRVWGARTLSTDSSLKYVSTRRFLNFLGESLNEGTQWVVFEPNDEPLWARVRMSITEFLRVAWRSGALQGQKEPEAFFVKCDHGTMSQGDIDAGRLICLVGVAIVRPAEFVILRISQKTATES